MVTTVVGEAKLSFFAQQVPKGDIALLKYVLTPLIGISHGMERNAPWRTTAGH